MLRFLSMLRFKFQHAQISQHAQILNLSMLRFKSQHAQLSQHAQI